MIGNRERAALHVGGLQLVLARAFGEIAELRRRLLQRQRLRALDHRHDQALVAERHAHADIDVLEHFEEIVVPARVDVRRDLHRFRRGAHDVGGIGERRAGLGVGVLVLGAMRGDGA